ncbi:hypothetical protein ABBQ38_012962 [Trebouxia sp. C0009 RCD-2024]
MLQIVTYAAVYWKIMRKFAAAVVAAAAAAAAVNVEHHNCARACGQVHCTLAGRQLNCPHRTLELASCVGRFAPSRAPLARVCGGQFRCFGQQGYKARGKLAGTKVGLDDDLTHLQQQRKNAAWSDFKDFRSKGIKTQWRAEKLFVKEGEHFVEHKVLSL